MLAWCKQDYRRSHGHQQKKNKHRAGLVSSMAPGDTKRVFSKNTKACRRLSGRAAWEKHCRLSLTNATRGQDFWQHWMMLGEYSSATEFLADTWWWSSCISEWCHESGLLVRCGGKHKWQGKLLSPNAKLWIPNPVTFVRIWKAICCQCTGNRMTAGGCSWSAHSKVSDEGFAYVCGGAVWWVYMANAERSLKEACDTTVH